MGTGLAELYREEIERTENGIEDLEIKFLNWKYDDTVTKGEVELKNSVYCVNSHFGSYYMGGEIVNMTAAGYGQAKAKANYRVMAYDAQGKLLGVAYAEAAK